MILVKHLMDEVELADGMRIWVEPYGLTRDLQDWCRVDRLLHQFSPPRDIREWFEDHRDGYEYFRGVYHSSLNLVSVRPLLAELAWAGVRSDYTLLHQGMDPAHNTATALHEFLSELQAYCPPEM